MTGGSGAKSGTGSTSSCDSDVGDHLGQPESPVRSATRGGSGAVEGSGSRGGSGQDAPGGIRPKR